MPVIKANITIDDEAMSGLDPPASPSPPASDMSASELSKSSEDCSSDTDGGSSSQDVQGHDMNTAHNEYH